MADIRINALATTAASTASDDFIAVDGSANGTRKLSAYSPTFGGNLTVSGTDIKINNSTGYLYVDSGSSLTGVVLSRSSNVVALYTANTECLRVNSSGNFLLGTTTDSGNGKLQLATHTTSAGGIGFGTEASLYRYGGGILGLDHIGGSVPGLTLLASGTRIISIYGASNSLYIDTFNAAGAMYLRTGAQTTALTLDSSQRCILAGALRLNNAYVSGAPTATGYVTLQDSAGNTYKVLVGT